MNNKKAFTLTEILLAVMIVAIIGVALASLTTAASRESGIGSSKTLLRNNVSLALRQIRQDIHNATAVLQVGGALTLSNDTPLPVLMLLTGQTLSGDAVNMRVGNNSVQYITYCFKRGSTSAVPSGSYSGGTLYRKTSNTRPTAGSECSSLGSVLLSYVKYIPTSGGYNSPLFYALDHANGSYTQNNNLSGILKLNMVVEVPGSKPVVNDAVEEIFLLPNGAYR